MKRFFLLLFVLLIGVVLCVPVFAVDASSDQDGDYDEGSSHSRDDSLSSSGILFSDPLLSSHSLSSSVPVDSVSILSVAPVGPSGSGGLKDILLSLLGSYDPVVLEYSYTGYNGTVSYLREVQLDWPWIASAVVFLLLIYCSLATLSRAIFGRASR